MIGSEVYCQIGVPEKEDRENGRRKNNVRQISRTEGPEFF